MELLMRSIVTRIFLASLAFLGLQISAGAQPSPDQSKKFSAEVPPLIYAHWVNPLKSRDLSKTALVIYFELWKDGRTKKFEILKENVFWKTETNLSKQELSILKASIIDSVKKTEPFEFPNSPQSKLNKVGIVYYFRPGTKQPGELKVVHP
jgi:hypothetical protein